MDEHSSSAKGMSHTAKLAAQSNSREPASLAAVGRGYEQPPSNQTGTRIGKKKVTIPLHPEAHKQLRFLALERNTTAEALLLEATRDLFAKYQKLPIA